MEKIDVLRSRFDDLYKPVITKLIGAVMVLWGMSFIMSTGPIGSQLSLIISLAVAAVYFYSPGASAFIFCCLFFICTAHINCIFALVILGVSIFFCSTNYMQFALAAVTPACMALTGGIEVSYWCVFILFIYISARNKEKAASLVYSAYFALLLLMMGKFGLGNILYSKSVKWKKTNVDDIESFTANLDMKGDFNYFIENNFIDALTILCIFIVVGFAIHMFFSSEKILSRQSSRDIKDIVFFCIAAVLLICMNIVLLYILKTNCDAAYVAMLLAVALAYVISRPFASEAVLKTFLTKEQKLNQDNSCAKPMEAAIPKDSWNSIAGYENTKQELREAIAPYVNKDEYRKLLEANMSPIKGILLFGPPGTGKTTMARAIARETNMKLIVVSAGEFINKYVGESEKALREIFETAKENAPALICFDEIESFLSKRNSETRSYERNIITTFLSQMDGFNALKNVLVIGTTNRPELIDEAALRPGRFDKVIYVGAPDESARKSLFRKYLDKKANLDLIDIDRLVDNSERYTGADIKGVCEEAYRLNGFKKLTEDDVIEQLRKIRPSFTLDMKDEYYKWSKKFTRSTVSEKDYIQKKKNSLTWDDIKGMSELKEVLKKKIENPIKNIDVYRQYNIPVSKGILFFGPPGCGKTFFAKVVASECNTSFFTINGPELLSSNVGESERNLRKVFRDAREAKPSIIFFDEIDAIAQKREASEGSAKLINQLLTEMDGMESLDGVIVIAATNRPGVLDTALIRAGRFDTKIYIGMPDNTARADMLKSALEDIPNTLDYTQCAERLVNYSCADVTGVANKTKEFFVQRTIASGDKLPVTHSDFENIIKTTKASISETELTNYEKMKVLESIM